MKGVIMMVNMVVEVGLRLMTGGLISSALCNHLHDSLPWLNLWEWSHKVTCVMDHAIPYTHTQWSPRGQLWVQMVILWAWFITVCVGWVATYAGLFLPALQVPPLHALMCVCLCVSVCVLCVIVCMRVCCQSAVEKIRLFFYHLWLYYVSNTVSPLTAWHWPQGVCWRPCCSEWFVDSADAGS
jgi:hypothetical protein